MGVGAVGNRVLCGFPNPCGRGLGVHRDDSVHALCRGVALKPRRADLAERRMSTLLVIEHFDVVEQLHLGFATAREAIGELALERREERYHHAHSHGNCRDGSSNR